MVSLALEDSYDPLSDKDLPRAALLFYLVFLAFTVFSFSGGISQWDFKGYYAAAEAQSHGLDPYDGETLAIMAGETVHPYVYPPPTLMFFRLFTVLDWGLAQELYLLLKYAAMVFLFLSWRKRIFHGEVDVFYYLFWLMAYNEAVFKDVFAGNISLFEQVILWSAFYFLLQKRYALFSFFTVLASTFKLTPLAFLALLLFVGDARHWKLLAISAIAFSLYLLAPYVIAPQAFSGYLHNAEFVVTSPGERGTINPSSYAFAKEVSSKLGHLPIPAEAIYSLLVIPVLCFSFRACEVLMERGGEDRMLQVIIMSCLVYAIAVPRFKDYSYILLIAPTYYVLRQMRHTRYYVPLLIATVMAPSILASYLGGLFDYTVLFVAYGIWASYVNMILSDDVSP
ncbi:MAG: DUF2029 domain-containing protein [Candidatus Altiarchaeales archaeon]|nr:DUF2029 domain-containing protein [Candidatus Altiarchaeales archaeon]MBD3416386.1 DUF2029 domain-containing protein [Candidatus Altiarchaeales archaeon]